MRPLRIERPAVEAKSLMIPVTLGCSWAQCTFCTDVYDKPFRILPLPMVKGLIDKAAASGQQHERVFLNDGDALIVKHRHMVEVLSYIKEKLPSVRRVGVYGSGRDLQHKTVEQLRELKELGLGIVYLGFESGDDEILKAIKKASTGEEQIEAGRKVLEAGLLLSVTVIVGLGGVERSRENALHTAAALTILDPSSVRAHTLVVSHLAPISEAVGKGRFHPLEPFEALQEMRLLIENIALTDTPFLANMPSNYLPLVGLVDNDKKALVEQIDIALKERDLSKLRPESVRASGFV